MRREIWFLKWGASYIPIHWKGFAAMALVLIPTSAVIMVGQAILRRLGYGNYDVMLFMAVLAAGLTILFPIAKRHS